MTYKVTLDPDEESVLDGLIDKTGMAKVELVRRLFAWFASQPDIVRQSILGTIPAELTVSTGEILRRLAASEHSPEMRIAAKPQRRAPD